MGAVIKKQTNRISSTIIIASTNTSVRVQSPSLKDSNSKNTPLHLLGNHSTRQFVVNRRRHTIQHLAARVAFFDDVLGGHERVSGQAARVQRGQSQLCSSETERQKKRTGPMCACACRLQMTRDGGVVKCVCASAHNNRTTCGARRGSLFARPAERQIRRACSNHVEISAKQALRARAKLAHLNTETVVERQRISR